MTGADAVIADLDRAFGDGAVSRQETADSIPTVWVEAAEAPRVLRFLKEGVERPYATLYDLSAVDERARGRPVDGPARDFSVYYHLRSYDRNADLRVKVALRGDAPELASAVPVWPAADWYEREAWDMFGISFRGHPGLRRILMPPTWSGHPLRKDHPARATEMEPFALPDERVAAEQEALRFRAGEWGLPETEDAELMTLNLGPQHPGTHGLLRVVLQLRGEEIRHAAMDIGYHHRGAEKIGERQTWHTFIPYTDRVDYLSGVMNNLPYVLAAETLAGIRVPARAQVIRVMLAELFRISSHLVWFGTFLQDLGALSPVFYMFNDRERILRIVEAVCGARMHPGWFRIGGVAQDLPNGWQRLVGEFVDYFPARLAEYDAMMMENSIVKARTVGVGAYTLAEAREWGVTGPGLRACGLNWDLRKMRPYSGYEQFEFDVPTAVHGDCYDRARVRVAEMRQSLRIVAQCLAGMPPGPVKADHPLAVPPPRERMLRDIETLIHHFVGVSWGPVMPAGEAFAGVEATKGGNGYYLISDGGISPYRVRIRTPSFPHLQMVPRLARGVLIPDLLAILGSIDFVLADVDR